VGGEGVDTLYYCAWPRKELCNKIQANARINITSWRVRLTNVAAEKLSVLHILSMCL
jgi:hypothetical protein